MQKKHHLYAEMKEETILSFDQFNDLVELKKFRKLEKKYGFSKREKNKKRKAN